MNSDSREAAAWRSFGILTPDEADAFDGAVSHDPALEQACQDVDRLAAAIAVTHTRPVVPRAGQLDRLHRRLGLPSTRRTNWPAISGWAAAAALAGLAVLRPAPVIPAETVAKTSSAVEPQPATETVVFNANPEEADDALPTGFPFLPGPDTEQIEIDQTLMVKGETKRLIQEIEVLRDKLESFQIRDRERFASTPGMAWPIVVRMVPPDPPVTVSPVFSTAAVGTAAAIAVLPLPTATDDPPMTAMLGDALAYARQPVPTPPPVAPPTAASAIPIYDSARDKGTLVVNNLPPKTADESFNLWVNTENSEHPIFVGRLPESSKPGADSIDFSLGATAVVPSGFVLTRDPQGKPPAPSQQSTILVGPR